MIGAPEQDVTGVRADGSRVALISGGTWQRLPSDVPSGCAAVARGEVAGYRRDPCDGVSDA